MLTYAKKLLDTLKRDYLPNIICLAWLDLNVTKVKLHQSTSIDRWTDIFIFFFIEKVLNEYHKSRV